MSDVNFKEDIEKIKEDIKSLVERLKNIKDKSDGNILEELALLSSVVTKFRNGNNNKEYNNLLQWCSKCGSIISHPIKNIVYAFAAYAVFSMFFKKDK